MFIITAIIASSLLLLYTAYLLMMLLYWKQAINTPPTEPDLKTTVDVIVPFRNEEKNLEQLIKCLKAQSYEKSLVDYVLVDDHSTDSSVEIVSSLINEKSEFKLLQLKNESGKKAALRKGILSSKSELIVTIDADVLVERSWLQRIVSHYENERNDMIILPVMLEPAKGLFQKLQQHDFFNLAGLTGASAKMKSALMCNGANLCIRRKTYEEIFAKIQHQEIASGDDMFLMLAMKKSKKRIGYLFHNDVIVKTAPSGSLKSFISQRIRWAAKARFMLDKHIILSGLLITFTNLSLIVLAIVLIVGKIPLNFFLSIFSLKFLVDFIFLRSVAIAFGKNAALTYSIVLSIIYPFYILVMPLLILLYPAKWKGRTISLPASNS